MLRDSIEKVFNNYLSAEKEQFENHPVAEFLRNDFPNQLKNLVENADRYIFRGSAGQGTWAKCPWVAVLDILITETAQSGYYPVYLFRKDMKGLYLSLNQGITEIREKYKDNPKHVLGIRASDFRAQLGKLITQFPKHNSIDLGVKSSSELGAFYEIGNICAKYYSRDNLPPEETLESDFRGMIRLYEFLSYNENIPMTLAQREQDEQDTKIGMEDLKNLRLHKRIERNSKLVSEAKKIHGYKCQACGFRFEKRYGDLGKGFIEAHHLIPLSQLKGKKIALNPEIDFAVLCSNCHSMIHRFGSPEDIAAFRDVILLKNIE